MKPRGHFAVTPSDSHAYSEFNNEFSIVNHTDTWNCQPWRSCHKTSPKNKCFYRFDGGYRNAITHHYRQSSKDNPDLRDCFQSVFEILL